VVWKAVHPVVRAEIERVVRERAAGGDVLELGATPTDDTLLTLPALLRRARTRVGLGLGGGRGAGFTILRGNANRMPFAAGRFDTILSNSMLEHDGRFWLTLAELRRVARPGAVVILGVPAYVAARRSPALELLGRLGATRLPVLGRRLEVALASTPTLVVHDFPGDYYRFSAQAMREVLLEGLREVAVTEVLSPPRLIGSGLVGA
jgi:SAM-dependent methyltransferase